MLEAGGEVVDPGARESSVVTWELAQGGEVVDPGAQGSVASAKAVIDRTQIKVKETPSSLRFFIFPP